MKQSPGHAEGVELFDPRGRASSLSSPGGVTPITHSLPASEARDCVTAWAGRSGAEAIIPILRSVASPRLELILRAVDVPEPLQSVRAQGETEARPVGRMHHAVRTDVEWLVEELRHHRHPALAYLENMAIGGCHRD